MRVYVVMSNDYPDSVFAAEGAAKRYVNKQNAVQDDEFARRQRLSPRIYWRIHAFDVEEAA